MTVLFIKPKAYLCFIPTTWQELGTDFEEFSQGLSNFPQGRNWQLPSSCVHCWRVNPCMSVCVCVCVCVRACDNPHPLQTFWKQIKEKTTQGSLSFTQNPSLPIVDLGFLPEKKGQPGVGGSQGPLGINNTQRCVPRFETQSHLSPHNAFLQKLHSSALSVLVELLCWFFSLLMWRWASSTAVKTC